MSFTGQSRQRTGPVLPLSALVDVLFLLLIFFMVASVMREQEQQIDVSLAQAQAARQGGPTNTAITLNAQGEIFLGDRRVSLDQLRTTLRQLALQFPDEAVIIRADQKCDVGTLVRVLDVPKTVGLTNVHLAARKPASELD